MNTQLNPWEALAIAQQAAALGDPKRASDLAGQVIRGLIKANPALQHLDITQEEPAGEQQDDHPGRVKPEDLPFPVTDVEAAVHIAETLAKSDLAADERCYRPPLESELPELQLLVTSEPAGVLINGYAPISRSTGAQVYGRLKEWFKAQANTPHPPHERQTPREEWVMTPDQSEILVVPEPGWQEQADHELPFTIAAHGALARGIVLSLPLLRIRVEVMGATTAKADALAECVISWLLGVAGSQKPEK